MLVAFLATLRLSYLCDGIKWVLTIHFSGPMHIMTLKEESLGCLGRLFSALSLWIKEIFILVFVHFLNYT